MAKCMFLAFITTASALVMKDMEKPEISAISDEGQEKRDVYLKPKYPVMAAVENKPIVQNLQSDEGMAYYGTLYVGGQKQVAIYDTGSFDVVIASKCLDDEKEDVNLIKSEKGEVKIPKCCNAEKCPKALYNSRLSGSNFVAGNDSAIEQITYGSGPVIVKPGKDHMRLVDETNGKTKGNEIAQASVPVKVIVDHEVDLFKETEMSAIVGVGPGAFAEREKRLVHNMGIKRFMVCFQENKAADGYWVWNDKDRSQIKEWMAVPVAGKNFWALPTSEFKLDKSIVGCKGGCGGIIDTGTSLMTPPQEVVDAIKKKIEKSKIKDCSDLSKFPDFVFKLGEHTLSLPPSSYIADAGPQLTEVLHQQLAFAPLPMGKRDLALVEQAKEKGLKPPPVHSCVLLLSPNEEKEVTQFGPMVIFGMSLFRKYAVQFDLSGDMEGKENSRFMRFAEAASDCSGPVKGGEFRRKGLLQKVNMDKLRVSPLQQRLMPLHDDKDGMAFRRKGVIRI